MTEFRCPVEFLKVGDIRQSGKPTVTRDVVLVADLPALCRAEVLRFVHEAFSDREARADYVTNYLSTRFPEPAPERCHRRDAFGNQCEMLATTDHDCIVTPQPSAEPCKHPKDWLSDGTVVCREGCGWVDPLKPVTPSAGERKVPQNILDAIGRYGTAIRTERQKGHDLDLLAAYSALLDEIRPLVPTPSAGEEGRLCIECGGPRKNTPERLSFCDACWEKRTPNQVHPTEPGYRWSPGAWRHIQTGQVLGVSAGETKPCGGCGFYLCRCRHIPGSIHDACGVKGGPWLANPQDVCALIRGHSGDHQNTKGILWPAEGPAVGARPEEGKCPNCATFDGKLPFNCSECGRVAGPVITPAERDFLRLIADALGRNDNRSLSHRLETYGGALLVEAARRVTA